MNGVSFRTVSTIITMLLLVAVAGVIWLVVANTAETSAPAEGPSVVDVRPTNTPQSNASVEPNDVEANDTQSDSATTEASTDSQPTSAAAPSSDNLAVQLLPPRLIEAGNFEFQPLAAYTLTVNGSYVDLKAPNATETTGPQIALNANTLANFGIDIAATDEETFEQFLNLLAQDFGFSFEQINPYSTGKVDGLITEIGRAGNDPFAGRIFMAQPSDEQIFLMVGVSPVERWTESVSDEYDAVLASVSLLDAPVEETVEEVVTIPPTSTPVTAQAPNQNGVAAGRPPGSQNQIASNQPFQSVRMANFLEHKLRQRCHLFRQSNLGGDGWWRCGVESRWRGGSKVYDAEWLGAQRFYERRGVSAAGPWLADWHGSGFANIKFAGRHVGTTQQRQQPHVV